MSTLRKCDVTKTSEPALLGRESCPRCGREMEWAVNHWECGCGEEKAVSEQWLRLMGLPSYSKREANRCIGG